jgi:D-serine deaminase-like pyridoxal phosphate-dependent protein
MKITDLETPALIINNSILQYNLRQMQNQANLWQVNLRPHTKTHKSADIAKMQVELGSKGITVAKVSEAEVMAASGLDDIFIANEIVSVNKLKRISSLTESGTSVTFGVDSAEAIEVINSVFTSQNKAHILIEVDAGDHRCGIRNLNQLEGILGKLKNNDRIVFEGLFTHEGQSYKANTISEQLKILEETQNNIINYANHAKGFGFKSKTLSIGSTPSLLSAMLEKVELFKEITEIRPGTYPFMDASQALILETYKQCAATVLVAVVSKPAGNQIVVDAGSKTLTAQSRKIGMLANNGFGLIADKPHLFIERVYDEHGVIIAPELANDYELDEKLKIIPNHICPVVNLFDVMYLTEQDRVIKELPVTARGKLT